MSNPATPSAPTPAGDPRNLGRPDEAPVVPSFEERLRLFWQRNSKLVTGVLAAVLLAIVAKGAWEYLQAERDKETGRAFAAATTPAQLKAFVAAHDGHPLAGAAQLRMADEAYTDRKFTDAVALYEQAIPALPNVALASRARLGLAMSKLQGGRVAEGEAALKTFAADEKEMKAFRAEAMYHLATHGLASGKAEDVKAYADQLMQLDPTSPWTQRAMMLRASAPVPAVAAPAASDGPAITLPGAKK